MKEENSVNPLMINNSQQFHNFLHLYPHNYDNFHQFVDINCSEIYKKSNINLY